MSNSRSYSDERVERNLLKLLLRIKKKFPELDGVPSKITYKNLNGNWAEWEGEWIYLDEELRNAKDSVKMGYISHEIAHVLRAKEMSKKRKKEDAKLSNIEAYLELEERDVDLRAIIHGCGKYILACRKSHYARGYKHLYGLRVKEIKKLIKK